MARALKHWGWGYEDEQPSPAELRDAARSCGPARVRLGRSRDARGAVGRLAARAQAGCAGGARGDLLDDHYERALHGYGRSYRDVVRAFRGRFDHPPDVVAHPRNEEEVDAMLDWALSAGAAVIPFGGGTSVVGGVEAPAASGYAGVVTIDLKALDRVLEVDPVSLSARIQAGATGPASRSSSASTG